MGRNTLKDLSNDDELYEVHQSMTGEFFNKISSVFESSDKIIRLKSRELQKETTT